MSSHNCLWLEFGGAPGDHTVSDPFSFVRFVGDRIEGGEQQQPIARLREDRWLVKPHEAVSFSRLAGLGVFSVWLEHFDGSTLAVECTRAQMNGTLLMVDSWTVALFERTRAAWVRLDTNTPLRSIRMEANAAARDISPPGHARPVNPSPPCRRLAIHDPATPPFARSR